LLIPFQIFHEFDLLLRFIYDLPCGLIDTFSLVIPLPKKWLLPSNINYCLFASFLDWVFSTLPN